MTQNIAKTPHNSAQSLPDPWILIPVLIMIGIGPAMIMSASFNEMLEPSLMITRQLFSTFISLGLIAVIPFIRLSWLPRIAPWGIIGAILLLVLALVPSLSTLPNVHRWLSLGIFSFQPSEIAKVALILYLAHFLNKKTSRPPVLWMIPPLFLSFLIALLIGLSPDFSTGLLVIVLIISMLYVSGIKFSVILVIVLLMLPLIYIPLSWEDFRIHRIWTWWHLLQDYPPEGIHHAFEHLKRFHQSVASGGWFGAGIGNGSMKNYLPEATSDSIFSVWLEEFGVLGGAFVAVLLGTITYRGLKVAFSWSSVNLFCALLAFGCAFLIGLQTLINIAVATTTLPVTGLPLPFLSAGGSSLLSCSICAGILLRLSRLP